MFEPLLSLGSRISRVFRVIGRLEFVRRLYDFWAHEGKRSRAQTLEQTAKVVLDLEKAEAQRIKNSRALLDLMKSAGFSEEKIQATLSNPQEMNRVSDALTTMLQYVDKGVVSLNVVRIKEDKEPNIYVEIKASSLEGANSQLRIPKKKTKRSKRT